MKIVSLNCFMGHVFESLLDFLVRESATTDVFCLQEMQSNPKGDLSVLPRHGRADILEQIKKRLPGFVCYFAPAQDDFDIEPAYRGQMQLGNATFYRPSLPVSEAGSFFIYNGFNTYTGAKQWETLGHVAISLSIDGPTPLTIVNVHGNSQPADKLDSPKRLEQSQKIIDFLAERTGEKIVMGDFNLLPDTESVRVFERSGYRNLVAEYKISTTRGSHMRKLFPEYEHGPYGFQEFADYTFVSPGINVSKFEVPDVPISDHLPMILEIDG